MTETRTILATACTVRYAMAAARKLMGVNMRNHHEVERNKVRPGVFVVKMKSGQIVHVQINTQRGSRSTAQWHD